MSPIVVLITPEVTPTEAVGSSVGTSVGLVVVVHADTDSNSVRRTGASSFFIWMMLEFLSASL